MDKDKAITILTRTVLGFMFAMVVVLFVLTYLYFWGLSHVVYDQVGKIRCSNYQTQEQAQQAFDSNTKEYAPLDDNHDGIACNDLSKN